MKHKIALNWKEAMTMEAEVNGHKLILDMGTDQGGNDQGPRPKPLILVAIAGCTALDVISILKKMKSEPEGLHITVEGTLTEEHPKVYSDFHIVYHFRGRDLDRSKLDKAISLSQEKYCGVSAMCKTFAPIAYEIRISD
jgi:putative redox protein